MVALFPKNRITHLHEPSTLMLVWTKPGLKRYVVGKVQKTSSGVELSYYPHSNDYQEAGAHGFAPLPAFRKPDQVYYDGVMGYFMSRVTRRDRPDFDLYVQTLGLNPDSVKKLSDFALLGYAEGALPSDGYRVINDYSGMNPPLEFVTEVAGLQYGECNSDDLISHVGSSVNFVREPDNEHDNNAVRIEVDQIQLGYINRVQAPMIVKWLDEGYSLSGVVYRKNGRPSTPRMFVFVVIN